MSEFGGGRGARFAGPTAAALALLAAGLGGLGCSEDQTRGVLPPGAHIDTFQQAAVSKVDVLWVIDNSPSMVEEKENLADNFDKFLGFLTGAQTDFRIGVTTTDVANDAGKLLGSPAVITNATPDPVGAFARNVKVGTGGSALEKGLDAARRTLELNPAGFLRKDAHLYIIFVSDEDDHSEPGLPKYYYRYFASLKGKGFESMISTAALAGELPDGCNSPNGRAAAAVRYQQVVELMGGRFGSICAPSFDSTLNELGIDAAGLKRKFNLSRRPDLATVEITVRYPCSTPDSLLARACTAVQRRCAEASGGAIACRSRPRPDNGTDGWTYEEASRSIVFWGAAIPPKGAGLEVLYFEPGEAPVQ